MPGIYSSTIGSYTSFRIRCTNFRPFNSIIGQEYTWGRLLVTVDVMKAIMSKYKVFTPYINYLQAFGYRVADEERSRGAYYWQKAQHSKFDGMFLLIIVGTKLIE